MLLSFSLIPIFFLLYEICLIVNKMFQSLIKRLLIDLMFNVLLIETCLGGGLLGQPNVYEFKCNIKFQRREKENQLCPFDGIHVIFNYVLNLTKKLLSFYFTFMKRRFKQLCLMVNKSTNINKNTISYHYHPLITTKHHDIWHAQQWLFVLHDHHESLFSLHNYKWHSEGGGGVGTSQVC